VRFSDNQIFRYIIITGIIVLVVGILWPWIIKLPLGKLPGDIVIAKPRFKICIPIATMLLISIAIL
jgi:hypothetical protein